MTAAEFGGGAPSTEEEPDAVARGWVERPGGARDAALFVLARESLGVGRTDVAEPPEWYDLRDVTGLDALGDPVGGTIEVEMSTADGRVVHASWPESFCDHVVGTLQATLQVAGGVAATGPVTPAAPVAPAAVPPPAPPTPFAPVSPPPAAAAPTAPPAPAPGPPAEHAPVAAATAGAAAASSGADMFAAPPATPEAADRAPGLPGAVPSEDVGSPPPGSTALVLEDVVYLGGYPGQTKKRKKCTATLTRDGVEVTGPNGLSFRVSWDVVRTIETQNSDEARFRMNTKVHRDATALVIECQQEVTILLEARDCPTIPLRTAIAQLVADLRVVVV